MYLSTAETSGTEKTFWGGCLVVLCKILYSLQTITMLASWFFALPRPTSKKTSVKEMEPKRAEYSQ